jgi:DNA-binding beta-propeller fold protein YncE
MKSLVSIMLCLIVSLTGMSSASHWHTAWYDAQRTGRTPSARILGDSLWLQYCKPVDSREACVTSSPEDLLFIGDTIVLHCWDAFTGADRWQYNTGVLGGSSRTDIYTAVLSENADVVYFVNRHDASWHGHVFAVHTGSGLEYWHNEITHSGSWVTTRPILSPDSIVYVSDNSNPDSYVHAFESDGTVFYDKIAPGIPDGEAHYWQAMDYTRNRHYVSGRSHETRILNFDLAGNYKWGYNKGGRGSGGIAVDSATGMVFASGRETMKLYVLDTLGSCIWERLLSASGHHPCVGSNNSVIVPASDTIFSFQLDGTPNWGLANPQSVSWSELALDADNNVCATTSDGRIFVINSDGTLRFSVKVSSSSLGPPVVVQKDSCAWVFVTDGDTLYALNDCNPVAVQETRARSYVELSICPNPFSRNTVISYRIPVGARRIVLLQIHDAAGRLVKTLVNEEKEPGRHEVTWNATGVHSQDGCPSERTSATGIYFVGFAIGDDHKETRKLILVR